MSKTFRQYEGAWASDPYPSGNTMAEQGCGPTSIANILANSILPNISPSTTGKYMNSKGYAIANCGSTWAGMTETLKYYGVNCTYIGYPSASTIWSHMDKGNRFIIFLFGHGTQGGVTWTGGGHFIAATAYKVEGNKHYFYTRDSGGRKNDGWHCYETTMSNLCSAVWICTSDTQPSKFKGNATPGDGTASGTDYTDNGQAFSLEQQIAILYSSDNYSFIQQEEETTSTSSTAEAFANIINQINPPLTEQSADKVLSAGKVVAHSVLTTALDELMAQALNQGSISIKKPPKQRGELLSYANVVEAPTIILNLNGVPIGGYGNFGDTFPNYITSMSVNKISGHINQYTINLRYTVRYGEDPNFIDKLLSRTGFRNKIQILYGDSNGIKLFRDDEAIVTDVTFNESVSSKTIDYTITAMSSVISAVSTTVNYASQVAKPSNLINELFYSSSDSSQALLEALPGMANETLVNSMGLIPTNDEIIETQTRLDTSPISQLAYYVQGMYNAHTNTIYTLTYYDDTQNELGGPYAKITEIGSTSTDTLSGQYFEVDVGYPGNNFVMDFTIDADTYFPLVYRYNDGFTRWDYDIDNEGNIVKVKTNPLLTNNVFHKRNVIQSNWWKRVTEYPISATLTIKGLVKPIMITSYIKVNVLFYGSTDLASGLYTVLGQTDTISGSGYTTTLSLLRVGDK